MKRLLPMNTYDLSSSRNIGVNNNINAVGHITADNELKRTVFGHKSETSTFTGDISAPNMYKKTQVNELLTEKRIHLI